MRAVLYHSHKPTLHTSLIEERLRKEPLFETILLGSRKDVLSTISQSLAGLIFFTITKEQDAKEVLTLIEELGSQSSKVRLLGISYLVENPDTELIKARCPDLLDHDVPMKTFQHKVENSIRLLKLKKAPIQEKKAQTKKGTFSSPVRLDPALRLPGDCWLFNPRDARSIMGNWMILLLGLGPSYGKWEKSFLKNKKGESGWQWTPRDKSKNAFFSKEGVWIYFGKKPEFLISDLKWKFTGTQPSLGFYKNGKPIGFRFYHVDGFLFVAQNSKHAEKKRGQIQQSLSPEELQKFHISSFKRGSETEYRDRRGEETEDPSHQSEKEFTPGVDYPSPFYSNPDLKEKLFLSVNLSPNKDNFLEIKDAEVKKGLAREAGSSESSITLWTDEREEKIESYISDFHLGDQTFAVKLDVQEAKKLIKKLQDEPDTSLHIKYNLPRGSFFYKLTSEDARRLLNSFRMPVGEQLYGIQRRKNMRFTFPKNEKHFLTVGGMSRPMKDLSAGGCSFLAEVNEAKVFFPTQKLNIVEASIDGIDILSGGEVRWVREIETEKDHFELGVGIQFQGLDPEVARKIESYVYERLEIYLKNYVAV